MNHLLGLFLLIPLLWLLLSFVPGRRQERLIAAVAITSLSAQFALNVAFVAWWLWRGQPLLQAPALQVFEAHGYTFIAALHFDGVTAVFALVGAFLALIVGLYSRIYLHREPGYKRFFSSVALFFLGYNVVVFSGNLETIFVGWEALGISSFLLVAFYRERYLPARNALKVFTVYRFGDVGLILAIWLSHHLFHTSLSFAQGSDPAALAAQPLSANLLALMLLLAAAAKSAQLPFSSWLPRAMEGPTPSSAIFYGSLSVHMGVFLLLRTQALWFDALAVRVLIGLLGLATAVLATGIARVQSSVKAQIAYSSVAQIGLMFIELAAGWTTLALLHFASNAFLRTYQLLVSPSVVSYLIREQFYQFKPREHTLEDSLPKRLEYSLYLMCLREWHLDRFAYRLLWAPLKHLGRQLAPLATRRGRWASRSAFAFGAASLFVGGMSLQSSHPWLASAFALAGLSLVLCSLAERLRVQTSWALIVGNHFWVTLAIAFNDHFTWSEASMYLSGVVLCGYAGYHCLRRLRRLEGSMDITEFQGKAHRHPKIGFVFLLCGLGLAGFPITPTFLGEDLVFSHIRPDQVLLPVVIALSYIVSGLAIVRIYAKLFFGPCPVSPHEMAQRSA